MALLPVIELRIGPAASDPYRARVYVDGQSVGTAPIGFLHSASQAAAELSEYPSLAMALRRRARSGA